jgi:hypothetical protein
MEYLFVLGIIGFCIVSRGFRILTFVVIGVPVAALVVLYVVDRTILQPRSDREFEQRVAACKAEGRCDADGFIPYKPPPPPGFVLDPPRVVDPFEAAGFTDKGPNSDAKPRQLRQR